MTGKPIFRMVSRFCLSSLNNVMGQLHPRNEQLNHSRPMQVEIGENAMSNTDTNEQQGQRKSLCFRGNPISPLLHRREHQESSKSLAEGAYHCANDSASESGVGDIVGVDGHDGGRGNGCDEVLFLVDASDEGVETTASRYGE